MFDCSGTITVITLLAAAPDLDPDRQLNLQFWAPEPPPTMDTPPPTEGAMLDDNIYHHSDSSCPDKVYILVLTLLLTSKPARIII